MNTIFTGWYSSRLIYHFENLCREDPTIRLNDGTEKDQRNLLKYFESKVPQDAYTRELAVALTERRYPTGWGGVGVVHTANGHYFTSVSIDTANASGVLCIETGAMLEAHKYNEKVTHYMCLVRDDENAPYKVQSPCGKYQERLRFWGEE